MRRAHLAFLLLMVLLARVPDLFHHYQDWDEAAMMSQAWAMTQGQVLYRDTFQIHPVLNFAVFYPFFALLPADAAAHSIKFLNLVLAALTAIAVYVLARRWTADPVAALVAGTLVAHYFGRRWGLSSYGEFYLLLPILVTVWLLFFREQITPVSLAIVGALWAIAFFIKQVALFDAAGLALGYLLFRPDRQSRKLSSGAFIGLGALAVFTTVAGYLAWKGTLGLALQSTLTSPILHYSRLVPEEADGVVLKIVECAGRAARGLAAAFAVLPAAFVAAALAPLASLLSARNPAPSTWISPIAPMQRQREVAVSKVLFLWMIVDLVGFASLGRFYPHYLVQILPPIALLAAYPFSRLKAPARTMLATIACLALLGNSAYLLSRALREDRGEPARVRESREIATFVAQATEPGDGIFLYRFQGLDVFYLSGRISNNGIYMFIDMFPEHIRDVEIVATRQRMFLERLPRILVRDPGGLLLGCDSAEPFFEAILEERYCLRRRFGEVEIHELCDDGPGQLRSGTGYDSFTENPRSGSCEADPSGSARSSS